MNVKDYIPTDELKPFIRSFKLIESQAGVINRVVPNTSFAMTFRLQGDISYINDSQKETLPAAVFSGLRKSVRLISYQPASTALVVLFTETGISTFFIEPLLELFEQSIPLDNLFRRSEIAMVEERLANAGTNNEIIRIVETFLLSKLIPKTTDKLVNAAISGIYANKGIVRIKDLSRSLYISQDAFEKRFREAVGATPKQFSSIIRLKHITQKATSSSLLDIAIENGYYDQAHLIKDFKLFTGLTPGEFYKSGKFW